MIRSTTTLALLLCAAVTACAAEPADTATPTVEDDGADTLDYGASYGGWTQYAEGSVWTCQGSVGHQLTRSWGDSTRSGGACFVVGTGVSCSSDSSCASTANAWYGSTAYGYCASGQCYVRPGSDTEFCVKGQNRSSGSYLSNQFIFCGNGYVLGCMSKTSTLPAACSVANAPDAMRLVTPVYYEPNG